MLENCAQAQSLADRKCPATLTSQARVLKLGASLIAAALAQLSAAHAFAQSDDAALTAMLRDQSARAHTHRLAWTTVNGALAVGSFALIPLVDRDSRKDYIVSGVGSVLGTVATVFFPLRVEHHTAASDFAADAEDERARIAWPWHLANLSVSALAGGIIGFGFHHGWSGVAQGVGSFALGEAQLFTQPTALTHLDAPTTALVPQLTLRNHSFGLTLVTAF